jgi:hypothetical protein
MKLKEIQSIAKQFSIKPGKKKKLELVRQIQLAEGNVDCFATAVEGVCDQLECLWRKECFKQAKKLVEAKSA